LGLVLATLPVTGRAGMSLDEALVRQRAIRGEGAGLRIPDTPLALDRDLPSDVTFAVGGPGNDLPQLVRPVIAGDGGVRVRTGSAFLEGQVQARFGAAWRAGDDHPWTFDESAISVPLGAGRLYASVERRHWAPSWTGSLILDAAARPLPAFGWRKDDAERFVSAPFSWLGPWRSDVFIGRLSQESGPEHAKLIGGRFQFMPLDGLEIALSRTMQWGGSGRSESPQSLLDAFLGRDNVDSHNASSEPGNQLAGYDARYTFRWGEGRSVSVYGQAIGEDEANHQPSHFLASMGVDLALPIEGAAARFFVERANTTANDAFGAAQFGSAYRHHIYTAGYTQLGDPLGHPIAGDARLTSAGVYVDGGAWAGVVMLHRGSAYATAQRWPGGGKLSGANAEGSWQLARDSRLGVSLSYWKDPLQTQTRAQLWWQLALP